MNRRRFLTYAATATVAGVWAVSPASFVAAEGLRLLVPQRGPYDLHIRDYLSKVRNYDQPHPDDTLLNQRDIRLLNACFNRLQRLCRLVGYGNFNLLSFDDAIQYGKQYPQVGEFSPAELSFMEYLFYADAAVYGFYGKKPVTHLTDRVKAAAVEKIPHSGNFLFRGEPVETWQTIRRTLGEDVVLTSGVRSVMKQFYLFLRKAHENGGNLSLASRSLAPPGYSFHGVGDFDVGKRGWGEANFTGRFTKTDVFRKLEDMGYLTLRYPQDNLLGVRFEPWHVKVTMG